MKQFLALLRLQMLTRYADLKPKNLKNALKEKRGRTIGMFAAILILIVYLGVILYIVESSIIGFLMEGNMNMADMFITMVVMLATVGTLLMAFFFIMSSLFLGRDAAFLASMPIKPRTLLGAKLTQIWVSETLIDAVIILPACILFGVRTGATAGFYLRMVIVWLTIAVLPICIAALLSSFLIRISSLWKHREIIMTVGGFALFAAYMFLMMNVGSVTGDSADKGEMIQQFFTNYSSRITGLTSIFPPAGWAARGLMGDWGQLALFVLVSAAVAAAIVAVMGIFYRKLSLLQSETPQANGKKGIQKGSIHSGSALWANVKREILLILRVPSYAINILPIVFMPVFIIVVMGMSFARNISADSGESLQQMMGSLNPAIVMCILAAAIAYMAGMNPALSTAVTREGRGHDFIKALPVPASTLIHAKLIVGFGLVTFGVVAAGVALMFVVPGFAMETVLAVILCLLFCFGCSCLALSRDVKKPRLDWVTEQEAVKQNFGVLISMLVSWGILALLGLMCFGLISAGCTMYVLFLILAAILALLAYAAYRLLMKNVNKYYCAG